MAERKRGSARDSFEALRESKDLGPYPSWDAWKSTLFNFLDEKLSGELEQHLHEWYILRREAQLGKYSEEETKKRSLDFSNEHDLLFDNELVIKAFKFITEKTVAK